MRYTVEIFPAAERFLRTLTDARLYRRLRRVIDALETTPRPAACVKLTGGSELYRVRVGDYRILYRVEDDRLVVLVITIGHRREVYR